MGMTHWRLKWTFLARPPLTRHCCHPVPPRPRLGLEDQPAHRRGGSIRTRMAVELGIAARGVQFLAPLRCPPPKDILHISVHNEPQISVPGLVDTPHFVANSDSVKTFSSSWRHHTTSLVVVPVTKS